MTSSDEQRTKMLIMLYWDVSILLLTSWHPYYPLIWRSICSISKSFARFETRPLSIAIASWFRWHHLSGWTISDKDWTWARHRDVVCFKAKTIRFWFTILVLKQIREELHARSHDFKHRGIGLCIDTALCCRKVDQVWWHLSSSAGLGRVVGMRGPQIPLGWCEAKRAGNLCLNDHSFQRDFLIGIRIN